MLLVPLGHPWLWIDRRYAHFLVIPSHALAADGESKAVQVDFHPTHTVIGCYHILAVNGLLNNQLVFLDVALRLVIKPAAPNTQQEALLHQAERWVVVFDHLATSGQ